MLASIISSTIMGTSTILATLAVFEASTIFDNASEWSAPISSKRDHNGKLHKALQKQNSNKKLSKENKKVSCTTHLPTFVETTERRRFFDDSISNRLELGGPIGLELVGPIGLSASCTAD